MTTTTIVAVPTGAGRGATAAARPASVGSALLLLPALLLLLVLFVGPLVLMAFESFRDGIGTYGTIFTSVSNRRVFANTLETAVSTTLVCLLLGYPYAYALLRTGRRLRTVLTACVLMPFWVSVLTRTFAWVGLLQDTGVINSFLLARGWIAEPLAMIRTPWGVLIGMVQVLLPYMVISLMNSMSTIDDQLLRAAYSLGATPWQRFRKVFLPLSASGIWAGCTLVFVLSLGFYITPSMLGAPSNMMVAELLVQETQKIGTVRASAIGLILLAGMLLCLAFFRGLRGLPALVRERRS